MSEQELITVPGEWHIEYHYTTGQTGSRFLTELRDNKKLLGTKCPKCKKTYLPPRGFCESCFVPIDEWVTMQDVGTIECFTFGPRKLSSGKKEPFVIAYVKLQGADTCIANFIKGIPFNDINELSNILSIGRQVKVEYEENRTGKITDFYFKLA